VGLEDSLRGKGERVKISCSPSLSTNNPRLLAFGFVFFVLHYYVEVRGL
jgi:hypothetical protein